MGAFAAGPASIVGGAVVGAYNGAAGGIIKEGAKGLVETIHSNK